jgi:hypothetical protein
MIGVAQPNENHPIERGHRLDMMNKCMDPSPPPLQRLNKKLYHETTNKSETGKLVSASATGQNCGV